MKNLKCFNDEIEPSSLDRATFCINHNLVNHPALSLENLAKMLGELPQDKILYSTELEGLNVNFDKALNVSKTPLDFNKVIETIKVTNSYIAIKNPEAHPSFKELYSDLHADISKLLKANKTGNTPLDPKLWIFIASPNTVTPFHFDRYSHFIMQIRGSKQLAVFPPRKEEVFSSKVTDAYVDWSGQLPAWDEELDQYAHKYEFKTGQAVHIPFVSGHYVKNGSEDISISLSFFFQSEETMKWTRAMKFNNRMRRMGLNLGAIGQSKFIDGLKAAAFSAMAFISELIQTCSEFLGIL